MRTLFEKIISSETTGAQSIPLDEEETAIECPICLDTLDATGVIHRPGCGTKFHTHCALGVQGNRCPICRKTNWIHYYP